MKICDLTQSYTETSGGVRTFIHTKRNYITEQTKHQHLLIVPGEQDSIERDGRATTVKIAANRVRGCEPYRFITRLDKVFAVLQKERPDIIELGSGYIFPYVAFLYRAKYNKPVTAFYHTDFPSTYVYPALRRLSGRHIGEIGEQLTTSYVRTLYNRFDATVVSSEALYKKLTRNGIRRLSLIPLGVDTEMFHPRHRSLQLRRKYGIQNDQLMLFYHGRLDYEKRIRLLLDAFDKVSDKINGRLLIMGEGPLRDYAQQMAASNNKILILPYEQDRELLARHLASADIYCTAGPHETFGLSVVEAQASGLAVCGVRAGALKERITEHVGLMAKPDSVSDYAGSLLNLAQNGYPQKGINARHLIANKYSWSHTFSKLQKIYDKAVQQYKS